MLFRSGIHVLGSDIIYIHRLLVFLTPYLHVYGVRICFIFMSDVFDVVRGGSRSHLLVGIYMIHHSPPLPV